VHGNAPKFDVGAARKKNHDEDGDEEYAQQRQ